MKNTNLRQERVCLRDIRIPQVHKQIFILDYRRVQLDVELPYRVSLPNTSNLRLMRHKVQYFRQCDGGGPPYESLRQDEMLRFEFGLVNRPYRLLLDYRW
jgi:hypothetical protein